MDSTIQEFIGITNASAGKAQSYLKVCDGNLVQALQLFFDTGGADMDTPAPSQNVGQQHGSSSHGGGNVSNQVGGQIDVEDEDFRVALDASKPAPAVASQRGVYREDDDEAMARRLQEELYSDTGISASNSGVRAPIARTTETLVGPDEDYLEHMSSRSRQARPNFTGRPGIFNQRPPAGVWSESGSGSPARHNLAAATGGASEQSSKHHTLAEMYRPPYEIMQHISFEEARDQAKEDKKWILVNIQDSSIFDCQVLNRDIWKVKEVKDTIRENFLFLQYDRAGIDGQNYVRLYFPHAINVSPTSSLNPFPVVAIVDPRTGEQVKVWSDTPKKPLDFVMQLHEFLERYSLHDNARNPVQKKSKTKVDVSHMSEEEMLELALQNSLDKSGKREAQPDFDPDNLTRVHPSQESRTQNESGVNSKKSKGQASAAKPQTAFDLISTTSNHSEPPVGAPGTTRIQLKLADGSRVVRRFLLSDAVRVIYEYIKADLLSERAQKAGEDVEASKTRPFELVNLGKNLIESLDLSIEQAGLKMGTIMIEFTAED